MKPYNVVAIIQARMGSTRLPGKVMMPMGEETVLDKVVKRTKRSRLVNSVVVATSDTPQDDCIASHCKDRGWICFRGSEHDVLSRYRDAATMANADVIVRITADCPLTDPDLVNLHVHRMLMSMNSVDIVTNMMEETYPLGLAVEVFPKDVLDRCSRLSTTNELREHVTTLVYEKKDLFIVNNIVDSIDRSWMRMTLDYQSDLILLQEIFNKFKNDTFTWKDAVSLIEKTPSLLNSCKVIIS